MEEEYLRPADGLKVVLQNGCSEHLSATGGDGKPDISETDDKTMETAVPHENLRNSFKLADEADVTQSKEESNVQINTLTISSAEDNEVKKAADCCEQSKSQKSQPKSKKERSTGHNNVASRVKKTKDGTNAPPVTCNTSNLRDTKQPIKGRSFNNMQPQLSEQSRNSDEEGLREMTNLKPLKNDHLNNKEEELEMSTIGRLPNYNFGFRCNERAEKRKEFYSKLEEKIQEMELEKNNLQAKSKETQETELKLLRKTLTFKATPMPSFYQEPPPPKAELKKIPPTRAKSPKFGRKKSSNTADSESNDGLSAPLERLSLDGKESKKTGFKASSSPALADAKKPQRKSLPRLPSEKTTLSTNKARTSSSKLKGVDKTSSSNGKTEENPAFSMAENEEEEEEEEEDKLNSSNEEAENMNQPPEGFPSVQTSITESIA